MELASATGKICGGGMAGSFAASALQYPQPFVAPESLQLLVVDRPALGPGVVVGGPEPTPRMRGGPAAQPVPQRLVMVDRGGRDGRSALSCPVLPR